MISTIHIFTANTRKTDQNFTSMGRCVVRCGDAVCVCTCFHFASTHRQRFKGCLISQVFFPKETSFQVHLRTRGRYRAISLSNKPLTLNYVLFLDNRCVECTLQHTQQTAAHCSKLRLLHSFFGQSAHGMPSHPK